MLEKRDLYFGLFCLSKLNGGQLEDAPCKTSGLEAQRF